MARRNRVSRTGSRALPFRCRDPLPVPFEIRPRHLSRVEPQELGDLLDETSGVDEHRHIREVLLLYRLEVRERDLGPGRDVLELRALRLTYLAEQRSGELRLGRDLTRELLTQHRAFGLQRGIYRGVRGGAELRLVREH